MKTLLAAALVVALVVTTSFGSSGLARNNPGNLVKTNALWEGQIKGKGRFATFKDEYHGLRALGIVLVRYQQRHGIDTIEKLIARFAPQHENDVVRYKKFVASAIGVSYRTPINISNRLPDIMKAIIQFENGVQPYSDEKIIVASALAIHHCNINK